MERIEANRWSRNGGLIPYAVAVLDGLTIIDVRPPPTLPRPAGAQHSGGDRAVTIV